MVKKAKSTRFRSWKNRIENAEKRGYFLQKDKEYSTLFNRCAIGERLGFPKTETGIVVYRGGAGKHNCVVPAFVEEARADELAMEFYDNVQEGDVAKARQTWEEIQKLGLVKVRV